MFHDNGNQSQLRLRLVWERTFVTKLSDAWWVITKNHFGTYKLGVTSNPCEVCKWHGSVVWIIGPSLAHSLLTINISRGSCTQNWFRGKQHSISEKSITWLHSGLSEHELFTRRSIHQTTGSGFMTLRKQRNRIADPAFFCPKLLVRKPLCYN